MARRTKFTPEIQEKIIAYVRQGAWDYIAAEAAGIHRTTFANWLQWGEKGNATYKEFFVAVCRAKAEARLIAENWVWKNKPDAWLGKGPGRSKPGRDGWTDRVEVTGEDGGPIVVKGYRTVSPDDWPE